MRPMYSIWRFCWSSTCQQIKQQKGTYFWFISQISNNIALILQQIMKSFGQQLSQLFSFAGYKTNAKLIPCNVAVLPYSQHPHLSFKCDIAHQIYNYYKKYGFKFSEKGVTPKLIAQEIDIYVSKSHDYTVRIDSFGHFIITPSGQYYQKLQERSIGRGWIEHEQVISEGIQNIWHSRNNRVIFYQISPLNLSTLRLAYFLTLLQKKYNTFKEYKPQQITTIVDISNLTQQDIKVLQQLNLIDKNTLILNTPNQINTTSLNHITALNIGPKDAVITATLRHQNIPHQSKYKDALGANAQILSFADIYPYLQVHRVNELDSNNLKRILHKSLQTKISIPIDLRSSIVKEQPTELLQSLKNRNNRQKLLILLQHVQQNKLIDLVNLSYQNISQHQYKPFNLLRKQINSLL